MELNNQFLKPETRYNYYISTKIKEVWAKELDLLNEFKNVCERNDLHYFIDGGTLLGAVRHKGFIPWDDDVDVIMPRKDYDKLWKIADREFKTPYFFQTSISENNFFRSHAQLRNSDTTGCIVEDADKHINRGIFLDIFPLDSIPNDIKKRNKLKKEIEFYKKIFNYRFNTEYESLPIKGKIIYCMIYLFFILVPYKRVFQHFNHNVLGKYSKDDTTEKVADLSLDWRENVQWQREWFSNYIYLRFENLMLRAPEEYDKVLTHQYGDYMKIPSDINAPNGKCHGMTIFEPGTPYKEYFGNKDK